MASISGNWVRSAVVPEPSTAILAGLGLVGLASCHRRRAETSIAEVRRPSRQA